MSKNISQVIFEGNQKRKEENEIFKRSRYIEKLIREDMEKRGKNIEKEF